MPAYQPNNIALQTLKMRYLLRDETGKIIETPDEMFRRVADHVAAAEANWPKGNVQEWADTFCQSMSALDFLPNSPTLMNAGTPMGQLSACFVIPIEDSIDSIFDAAKHMATIFKSGGGVGMSFSSLRPEGAMIMSTKGKSTGPVSFMDVYNVTAEVVMQGGKRRGATMGCMRVNHPDIRKFIHCKDEDGKLASFNISVAVTDSFIHAVEIGADYMLRDERGEVVNTVCARDLWREIVEHAWKNGDPGLVFITTVNKENPTPKVGRIEATNPCGEVPLLPYESCNLASINLANMTTGGGLDLQKLRKTVRIAVRFLDNVIEMNKFPLPEIEVMTRNNRKVGLGVMGLAEFLIKQGLPYDSDGARACGETIMGHIRQEAYAESERLARVRGAFPNYPESVHAVQGGGEHGIRNATLTAIAPNGSIGTIAMVNGGIEPLFAVAMERRILDGETFYQLHPLFEQVAKERGFYSDELVESLKGKASIQDVEGIPDDVKLIFRTAHDVSVVDHLKMQAAFQKHTCNAVSKTINLPHDATVADVSEAYRLAHKLGCKGTTVYRDGSRDAQPLSAAKKETKNGAHPIKRPESLPGRVWKLKTGCGSLFVTVTRSEEGAIREVFATVGKAGACAMAQSGAIGRIASIALRAGVDPKDVMIQLLGITCQQKRGIGPSAVLSCPDGIGKVLKAEIEGTKPSDDTGVVEDEEYVSGMGACPTCGSALVSTGTCRYCQSCGFDTCS